MGNLATVYQSGGRLERALPLFEQRLALEKSNLGPDHPDTLRSMSNLAEAYRAAEQAQRRAGAAQRDRGASEDEARCRPP